MKQDRFDEFYMLQTKAKGLEKKNLKDSALNIYLDIIENYFPDTDYSFQRAVVLLQEKGETDAIKAHCELAIERIKASEMKGSRQFFEAQLDKLNAPPKAKLPRLNSKLLNTKNVAMALFIAASVLLSLPNKVFKFIFLLFGAIIALLIIDIVKRFKLRISIRLQTIGLIVATVVALGAAMQIPPPEWTNFFSLMPLSEIGSGTQIKEPETSETPDKATDQSEASQISEDDIAALKQLVNENMLAEDYTLKSENGTLTLTIYAKATASNAALKKYAVKILSELNGIKGLNSYENRLGDLYKDGDTVILCIDSYGKLKLEGTVNRYTLKVDWH